MKLTAIFIRLKPADVFFLEQTASSLLFHLCVAACSTFRNTGTRNTGTPEHHGTFRNTRKTRNTPKKPGTPAKNQEHREVNQEHPPKKPEHPQKTGTLPPPCKRKETDISKSSWRANMLPRA